MNVTITINCDNAAFDDNALAEVARILRKLADLSNYNDDVWALDGEKLRDYNGNTVGTCQVKE